MTAAILVVAVVVIFSAISGIFYYQGIHQPTPDIQPKPQEKLTQKVSIFEERKSSTPQFKEKVKLSSPAAAALQTKTLSSQIFTSNSKFYASLANESSLTGGLKSLVPASAVFSDIFYSFINSNRVFSPLSILNVLSILHQVSSNETRNQIEKALNNYIYCEEKLMALNKEYNRDINSPGGLITTYFAVNQQIPINQTFINSHLLPYCKIKSNNFNDSIHTNLEINRYFNERTEGTLLNAAKLIKYDSKVLIYNTFHIKFEWEYPFNPKYSILMNFTQNIGTKRVFRSVDNVFYKIPYYSDSEAQLIELNLKGNEYSMGFLLPSFDESKPAAILNTSYLYSMINKLKPIDSIRVILPKFRLKRVLRLMGWLKQLGIMNIFDIRHASFPLLAPEGGFAVTEIIHDGMMSIDELGVNSLKTWWKHYSQQQQALSALSQKGKGGGKGVGGSSHLKKNETIAPSSLKASKEFVANHNFLFYIRHKLSNLLLFVGDFDG